MKDAVICFTRVPVPGHTKTRLMPLLAKEQCAELHTAFLYDTSEVCGEFGCDTFVCFEEGAGWQAAYSLMLSACCPSGAMALERECTTP